MAAISGPFLRYLNESPLILHFDSDAHVKLAEMAALPIVVVTLVYLPGVYALQWFMRDRPALRLKWVAAAWNAFLTSLSVLGATIIVANQGEVLTRRLVYGHDMKPSTRMVVVLFCLTKAVEYFDTILLVLKKRPLIFLHVYHHMTVTLYCWYSVYIQVPFAHFFVFVNLCVHSAMYAYYCAMVLCSRNSILRMIRPYITMGQLLQMFFGIGLSYMAIYDETLEAGNRLNGEVALAMYVSYAYLFADFFILNYLKSIDSFTTLAVSTLSVGSVFGLYHCMQMSSISLIGLFCSITASAVVISLFCPKQWLPFANYWLSAGLEKAGENQLIVRGMCLNTSSTDKEQMSIPIGWRMFMHPAFISTCAVTWAQAYIFSRENLIYGFFTFGCLRWMIEILLTDVILALRKDDKDSKTKPD